MNNNQNNLIEIRQARDHAAALRDQLVAEYLRVEEEHLNQNQNQDDRAETERYEQGKEAMRKAIAAANRALESIEQALREIERVEYE